MIVEVEIQNEDGTVISTLLAKQLPPEHIPKNIRVPLVIGRLFRRRVFVVVHLKLEENDNKWAKNV